MAEAMKSSIDAVRNEETPFSTASKQFNVPRNILKRRIPEKNQGASHVNIERYLPKNKKLSFVSIYLKWRGGLMELV